MSDPYTPPEGELLGPGAKHHSERSLVAAVSIGLVATIVFVLVMMAISALIGGISRVPFLPLALFVSGSFVSAYVSAKARPSRWFHLSCIVAGWWSLFFVFVLPILTGNDPRLTVVGMVGALIAFGSAYAGGRFSNRRAA